MAQYLPRHWASDRGADHGELSSGVRASGSPVAASDHPRPAVTTSPTRAVRPTALEVLTTSTRGLVTDILVKGPMSRADLVRSSGWSPASMTRITRPLLESRLLVETSSERAPRIGRPSLPLDVDVDLVHLVGVNLTADALTIVRTDLRAEILQVDKRPLVSHSPEAVVGQIADAVQEQLDTDDSVQLLGVSLAGPFSPRSEMLGNSAFLGWSGVPLAAMLQERTGLLTIVDNDVRALTAAEHWFGAAAGLSNVAVVTVGAGIGCGLVVDDKLVEGDAGGSGHVGHLPITVGGPMCERGHRGCARSYLASSVIVGQLAAVLGRPELTFDDLVALTAEGHPLARRIADDAADALGQIIGTVSAFTAPQKVLVSGEGVALISLVEDRVHHRAHAVQHWSVQPVAIELTPFGTTEWARGAAVSALRRHIENQTTSDDTRH